MLIKWKNGFNMLTRYYITTLSHKTLILTQEDIIKQYQRHYSTKQKCIYSYYNSDFDKIILDHKFMLIPIDDRMVTRAHAVFDTIYIKHMKIINMHSHISRLLRSAKSLEITSPLTQLQIEVKLIDLVQAAFYKFLKTSNLERLKKTVFGLRINISSGYGDFGIASQGKKSVFYASVFQPFFNFDAEKEGVNEYIAKRVNVMSNQFVHSKTVNYAENALMANFAKRKGGYQGIKVTKDQVILEASVANVAFMFKNKEFATPRLQTVIQGTTLKQAIVKLKEMLENGIINKVSFRDITLNEAYNATQMMVIGGDKIVPVLNLDDKPISSKKGQITTILQNWYELEIEKGTQIQLRL